MSDQDISNTQDINNSQDVPKIKNRDEVIILGEDIECPCGRTKVRAHCPACGRVKLYASAQTQPVRIPDTIDVMKGCKFYRCEACGTKFSDIDWYFNCHALRKIDWVATRKHHEKLNKEQAFKAWVQLIKDKIRAGEKITYNDDSQCRKETGMSATNILKMLTDAERSNPERRTLAEIEENKQAIRNRIAEQEVISNVAPTQEERDVANQLIIFLKEKLEKLEKGG